MKTEPPPQHLLGPLFPAPKQKKKLTSIRMSTKFQNSVSVMNKNQIPVRIVFSVSIFWARKVNSIAPACLQWRERRLPACGSAWQAACIRLPPDTGKLQKTITIIGDNWGCSNHPDPNTPVNFTLPGLRFHTLQTQKLSSLARPSPDPRPALARTYLKHSLSNISVFPVRTGGGEIYDNTSAEISWWFSESLHSKIQNNEIEEPPWKIPEVHNFL